jgi:catechol 2,3-dioxygenase-like lactoylglutathione lyase family enzyme
MFHHVTREVRSDQISDCVRFYGYLGYERIEIPAAIDDRAVWLGHPEDPLAPQIHLLLNGDARPQLGHIALVMPSYEATVTTLREAGFDVEPRREHWGSPRCYVRDPASNVVELMEFAPTPDRVGQ